MPPVATATDPPPEAAATAAPKPAHGLAVTIAKNSIWLLVDSIAGMAASFFCSIFVARRLGPDFMGQYNYILYFVTVLRMVTEVAIPATVRKFAAEFMGRGDYVALKTFVNRAMWLQMKLIPVGVAAGLGVVFFSFSHEQRPIAVVAVLTIVPGLMLSIPTGALAATENLRFAVSASLAATTVNLTGVTISVIYGFGLLGLVVSLLTARTVDCVLRFRLYRQQYALLPGSVGKEPFDPALRRRMTQFAGLQLVLTILYALLFDRVEVFFLKSMAPSAEIAFFSITFTLVQYMLLFPGNLAGSASASMMVQQGRSQDEAARTAATTTWFMVLLAAPELFGVAALSSPLLRLMYGAKYLPAIPVLTALSLFGMGLALSQPAQYLLMAAERQIFYIVWLVLAAGIDVLGNVLLIPRYGALGAACAKGASQLFAAAGFLTYMVVSFKVALPLGRIAKLISACTVMFIGVRMATRTMPPLLALLVGVPVGVVIFVVLTRLLRCLDKADQYRLRQLERLIPGPLRAPYVRLVGFLAPTQPG